MIDRPHTGANRRFDPGRAVAWAATCPPPGRLLHRRLDFGVGILLPAGLNSFRKNCTRSHDFDEVRAIFEIGSDRFRDLFRPVRKIPDQRRVEIDGKLFRIARAAGGGNIISRHEQARPRHRALVDRVA